MSNQAIYCIDWLGHYIVSDKYDTYDLPWQFHGYKPRRIHGTHKAILSFSRSETFSLAAHY